MKYLFSDYYFLCAAADKETRTVGDAYRKMCAYLGVSSTYSCLRHARRGRVAGAYITVEPEEHGEARYINLGGSIQVTEAGRKAGRKDHHIQFISSITANHECAQSIAKPLNKLSDHKDITLHLVFFLHYIAILQNFNSYLPMFTDCLTFL